MILIKSIPKYKKVFVDTLTITSFFNLSKKIETKKLHIIRAVRVPGSIKLHFLGLLPIYSKNGVPGYTPGKK